MAVDTFTEAEFEATLETMSPSGWEAIGLDDGEYSYDLPVGSLVIRIRSSVHRDGESAAAGKDSIRVFILDQFGDPWGSKAARWVTRVSGWEKRLTELIGKLRDLIRRVDACPECGTECQPFRVRKKDSPHKGRWFAKCPNAACTRPLFEWLD